MLNLQTGVIQQSTANEGGMSENKNIFLLQQLLQVLALQGYRFITVTPITHRRFLARYDGTAKNLRDVFGWSLPFKANFLPPLIFDLMSQANLIIQSNGFCHSKIRVSSLNRDVFLHA